MKSVFWERLELQKFPIDIQGKVYSFTYDNDNYK